MESSPPSGSHVLAMALVGEGGLGLLALGLGWLLNLSPTAAIGWNWPAAFIGLAATVPLALVLLVVRYVPLGWFVRLNRVVDEAILPLFEHCTWLDFFTLSLLAGVAEELLFRGLVQQAVTQWASPIVGLISASVLFGLAHSITTGYAVFTGLFGLYLGGLFLWSGNLLVAIVAHAAYDFLALAYLVRRHDAQRRLT